MPEARSKAALGVVTGPGVPSAAAGPADPGSAETAPTRALPRLGGRLDPGEVACLVALTALAFVALGAMLAHAARAGVVFTGADGMVAFDILQYLNWIRQGAEHFAVANLYDIAPERHTFVHPGVLVSGLLHRAGLGVVAAYDVWKPVAVASLFAGSLLTVRRHLERPRDRRLALVLALFACSPAAAAMDWLNLGASAGDYNAVLFITGEMWAGTWLWGYLFTAIAVGLIPLTLIAYERGRAGGKASMRAWALVAALLCAWLQPWQGATLAVVLLAAELLWLRAERRRLRRVAADLVPALAAIAAPLLYYMVLSREDPAWKLAGVANNLFPRWPWWVLLTGLLPLAAVALLAYRRRPESFGAVALRAWPPAALLIYFQPAGTFPFHSFQGLQIPLAVLAVVAVRQLLGSRPLPVWPAVAVAALLVVPGTIYRLDLLRGVIRSPAQSHFVTSSESAALDYLARNPQSGGVLTSTELGAVVPARTGRQTWIGAWSWTPDVFVRRALATQLLRGALPPARAAELIRSSGAAFVLASCRDGARRLPRLPASAVLPPVRFGECAAVYPVRRAG